MGDRLRASISHRHVTSHPSQLSLLPSVGWEMSTGQCAVMLCGWNVLRWDGSFHSWINVWVAGKACDPSLTRAISERIRGEYTHERALYKCPLFIILILHGFCVHDFWLTYIRWFGVVVNWCFLHLKNLCRLRYKRLSDDTCLLRNCTINQRKHTTIIFACGCILLGQRCLYTKAHLAWRLFSATAELLLIFNY